MSPFDAVSAAAGYSTFPWQSQRTAPASIQAEQALLGAILANNRSYERVAEFLLPEHFADPVNGAIYDAISTRILDGHLADPVTLKSDLEHNGLLSEVGGTPYLAQLLSAMVTINMTAEYGRAIYDTWLRRRLIDVGQTIVERAYGSTGNHPALAQIDLAEQSLAELSGINKSVDRVMSIGEAVSAAIARSEAAYASGTSPALKCGMWSVDQAFGGFWPGTLNLLAGIPGSGKTALAVQIADALGQRLFNQAIEGGASVQEAERQPGVVVFSLEMSAEELGARVASMRAHISVEKVLTGDLDMASAADLARADRDCRYLPVRIRDSRKQGLRLLPAKVRMHLRRQPERLVIVDHMLIAGEEDANSRGGVDVGTVTRTARTLKVLAAETGLPFLVLTHSARAMNRTTNRPTQADIKWAGEGDADNIVFVHRPIQSADSSPPPQGRMSDERHATIVSRWKDEREAMKTLAELVAAKRRQGATGVFPLRFHGPTTSFHEIGESDHEAISY
jgi:replicative DNA helicase